MSSDNDPKVNVAFGIVIVLCNWYTLCNIAKHIPFSFNYIIQLTINAWYDYCLL